MGGISDFSLTPKSNVFIISFVFFSDGNSATDPVHVSTASAAIVAPVSHHGTLSFLKFN